jgi:transposase
MRFVPSKSTEQPDLQALHRVQSRLVSQRTAVINQIRGFWKTMALAPETWSALVEDKRTQSLIRPFVGFFDFTDHELDANVINSWMVLRAPRPPQTPPIDVDADRLQR